MKPPKNQNVSVTFSCLKEPRNAESEALNIFSDNEGDSYIREIVEKGLQSGKIGVLEEQINFLITNGLYLQKPAHVLGNIIFTLASKENRRLLAELICNNGEHLDFIEKASYLHGNGFKKIVLLATPFCKLRLHIWDTHTNKIPYEDIHDHRWGFASCMLMGSFATKVYKTVPSKQGTEKCYAYQYSPVVGEKYGLKSMGVSYLQESIPLIIKKGNGYYMPAETLHRVVYDGKERTMTMIITGQPVNNNCRLFAKEERQEEDAVIERMSKSYIQNTICELKHF